MSNVPRPPLSEVQKSQMVLLYATGKQAREIAKAVGCGRSSVNRMLSEWGLIRRPQLTTEQEEHILTGVNSGLPQREVGKKFGVGQGAVSLVLKRHGKSRPRIVDGHSHNWTGIGEIPGKHLAHYRKTARIRGIEFSVTKEYLWDLFLKQSRRCPYLQEELVFDTSFRVTTASLDRIDSKQGYVIGNVEWVHKIVNEMKWDYTKSEFISLCDRISLNAKRN